MRASTPTCPLRLDRPVAGGEGWGSEAEELPERVVPGHDGQFHSERVDAGAVFINGITIFEPGAAIQMHTHNCEESVLMLEGSAVAEIDGVEYPVDAGDITFIPAGIPHRFRNVSATDGMRILWTYASIDATRTLVETGDTRSIDDEHKAPVAD